VPAVPAYGEAGVANINTGIAMANTGSAIANVTYTVRDSSDKTLAVGHETILPWFKVACFIDELKKNGFALDFELPPDFRESIQFGSLAIDSDQPLSLVALRGTNNQRNDLLITTTPIADLNQPSTNKNLFFPQFVDGGACTTSLILINATDTTESGSFQIREGNGNPLTVTQTGGKSDYYFRYSIPPHEVYRFQSDGFPVDTKAGWLQVTPDAGNSTPIGSGIFGYNPDDVLVSESGIPSAEATTHPRVYVDLSANPNTGLAIANIAETDDSIKIRAFQMNGFSPAGDSQEPLILHPSGYRAAFADQFIQGLPENFTGLPDIRSATPFAALTLRSMLNERHDFLMTRFNPGRRQSSFHRSLTEVDM
jgi:hypothetical protein